MKKGIHAESVIIISTYTLLELLIYVNINKKSDRSYITVGDFNTQFSSKRNFH